MADFDLVIRGGTVVTARGRSVTDIGIRGGTIAAMGDGLAGREVIDAAGKVVTPGGVDPHAHIEQISGMGLMNADTWESGTRSAALGGTTTVIPHVPQLKDRSFAASVEDYRERSSRAVIDHAWHMIVADPEVDEFEDDLNALMADGQRTVKLFTTYNIGVDDHAILRVMLAVKKAGGLVCTHAENDAMIALMKEALVAKGMIAPRHHALSHPRLAEIEAVGRMCAFAEFTGQPVMIFHISTVEGAEIVRQAKARGVPVVAETCTHYLTMTEEVLDKPGIDGAKWMCSPPQRKREDIEALFDALADGTLSYVSSDHAPFTFDERGKLSAGPNPPFPKIANGMPGLEVRGPILMELCRQRFDLEAFVRWSATEPARIYGLERKGDIAEGLDADITIWRETDYTYGPADLHDATGYNPFEGFSVRALPERVILRGETIVHDGECLREAGSGRRVAMGRMGVAPTPGAPEFQSLTE
ncbi:MAG: dihydropyrimidinase [Rubricella sp.]